MLRLGFAFFNVAAVICALSVQSVVAAEERAERIAEGKLFLSDSRIDQWEKLFNEGIHGMGRIVVTKGGKVATEGWFEKQFMCLSRYEAKNRKVNFISNPDYLAEVRTRGSENRIYGIHPSASNSEFVYIEAMPFAVGSSVSFTRELIPTHLRLGKLQTHDYRKEGNKHIFEFQYSEDADKGLIELVFDEDIASLLPVETTFGKETPFVRHFISSEFREVAGYNLPMRVEEKSKKDVVTTEIFPDDRLDHEKCRLSYYGLPEPGELTVSDFGRKPTSWFGILSIALIVGMVAVGGYFWSRRQNTPRKQ